MSAIVACDWSAELFLHATSAGESWRFLSCLEEAGVPSKAAEFLRETTRTLDQTLAVADGLLRRGYLSEYQQVSTVCTSLKTQRAAIAKKVFESPTYPRPFEELRRPLQADACDEGLANQVATALHDSDHAVVDGFVQDAEASVELGTLLRTMHTSGMLQPGRIKGGLSLEQRSDLILWMPGDLIDQPNALGTFLSDLDRLLLALMRHPTLASELGAVPLVRAEVQCTCYPGNGR